MLYKIILMLCTILPLSASTEIPASTLQVMPPMDIIYHPVSTTNIEAQKSFNRGLTYIFAFNHDVAFKEFETAAQQDPSLAMAYWGMALALGQNMNEDVSPENELKSFELSRQALRLSHTASANEQAYIQALSTRYTNDPSADLVPLRFKYRDAMKKVKDEYTEDLDAAALYAESILNLDPWKWWTPEGKPREGTLEALEVLESVLRRNPLHLGANHYYIHACEESPHPEWALMSAHRLESLFTESGHLLHMPNHIFMLVGDYDSALKSSLHAIATDRAYIKKNGVQSGKYPLHYLRHNLYVLTRVYMLMENYPKAIGTALELNEFLTPYFQAMPNMAYFAHVPLEIYLYFHQWDEILAYKLPVQSPALQTYWHFCRAMAYASTGNVDSALQESNLMKLAKQQIPPDETIANNPASKVIEVAETLLSATIAREQNHPEKFMDDLHKAIALQDQLYYDEPPAWMIPLRQILGAALLQQEKYAEAEKAFKHVLRSLQRNGRSLFGLWLSLKGQGRPIDAYWVKREMTAALQNASKPLTLDDL